MKSRFAGTMLLAAMCAAPAAMAQEAGDWIARVGLHSMQPKSGNHTSLDIGPQTSLTFNATYMLAPNWGIDLFASLPFSHEINLDGAGKVAETNQWPPTLSLQYHFNPDGLVRPYIGAGLNYTIFFDEHTLNALDGSNLRLGSSFGPAARIGFDVSFASDWFISVDARWFDIDTKAMLNGVDLGTVEIDPYAFGVSVGHRF